MLGTNIGSLILKTRNGVNISELDRSLSGDITLNVLC